jgi:hypothetical protein
MDVFRHYLHLLGRVGIWFVDEKNVYSYTLFPFLAWTIVLFWALVKR